MPELEIRIPLYGGHRKLKSFNLAQLAHDVTGRFCDPYIEKRSGRHAPVPKLLSAEFREREA